MAKHNNFGKDGEAIARKYLDDEGYIILETNWRIGHLEADIIAAKDDLIVFVEVKTRTNDAYGSPESFVDKKKRQAYIRLANAYMLQKKRNEEVRFDIISIIQNDNETKVEHIVEAFTTIC